MNNEPNVALELIDKTDDGEYTYRFTVTDGTSGKVLLFDVVTVAAVDEDHAADEVLREMHVMLNGVYHTLDSSGAALDQQPPL